MAPVPEIEKSNKKLPPTFRSKRHLKVFLKKQRFAREMREMMIIAQEGARAPAQYIANQGTIGPLASCTVGRRGGVFKN